MTLPLDEFSPAFSDAFDVTATSGGTGTWYTIERAREHWPGAPMDDGQLQLVLDVSRGECVAFAPPDTTRPYDPGINSTDVPPGHEWAHLAHARGIWNAQKVNPSGGLGDDTQGFALTPWPIEWTIKQRLRPRVIFGGGVA